jgi:hypothetical protein
VNLSGFTPCNRFAGLMGTPFAGFAGLMGTPYSNHCPTHCVAGP